MTDETDGDVEPVRGGDASGGSDDAARDDVADDADREPGAGSGARTTLASDASRSDVRGLESWLSELDRSRVALWVVAVAFATVFAWVLWQYVGTVVVGLFAYYVTRPVFSRIVQPRVGSRTLAVVLTLLTVGLPVLVLVGWTVFVAVSALAGVLDSDVGGQFAALVEPYADLNAIVADVTADLQAVLADPTSIADLQLGGSITEVLDLFLGTLGQLFNVLLHAFVVLIITFYLLRDDHKVAAWARETFVAPESVLHAYFVAVDRDLKNVFFGNILNALLTGFLAVVTFLVLNAVSPPSVAIPEAVLVGLLVGVASLVPVIGIKLVTLPLAAYLFGVVALANPQDVWFPAVFLAVSFVVVDYVPDQLLRPYVSGRTLHVGLVMLAYTLGPVLFGWYGIFLGPLVLVVLFEFARVVVPWLYHPGDPPQFDAHEDAEAVLDDATSERDAGSSTADVDRDSSTHEADASDRSAPGTDASEH